jgi:hypothetical protein
MYYVIISLLLLINPTISLIIGIVYKDQCVIDQRIPIYMIVFGIFGCMLVSFLIIAVRILDTLSI